MSSSTTTASTGHAPEEGAPDTINLTVYGDTPDIELFEVGTITNSAEKGLQGSFANKKKRLISEIWDQFVSIKEGSQKFRKCTRCGSTFNSTTLIGFIIKHMKSHGLFAAESDTTQIRLEFAGSL